MKPIIFSTEMVRAILDGRKTQTRRVIKPQPDKYGYWKHKAGHMVHKQDLNLCCPYGQPGDTLWVRETWVRCANGCPNDGRPVGPDGWSCLYRATEPEAMEYPISSKTTRWHPSIHMPKWAARLFLEITDIRVERVHDISEEDAVDEGIEVDENNHVVRGDDINWGGAVTAFAELWDSINAKRGYSWDSNPWVWVVIFRRVRAV